MSENLPVVAASAPLVSGGSAFSRFVKSASAADGLAVQPRMGFSDPDRMRLGLRATRDSHAASVGTITIDSYTRVAQHTAVRAALACGHNLNGYPIVDIDSMTTARVLADLAGSDFQVQVRHGSAKPQRIVRALTRAGLAATEGGPVSYCLPYGRVGLRESVKSWAETCDLLLSTSAATPHLETFGGCLLGQLCPPGLLVAMSILEALFFTHHGIYSLSLSYAQQTNREQDRQAIAALRRLATELLPDQDFHVVVYAYMGVYPHTRDGALLLLSEAASLAVETGSERLIVKTAAEARRIPTITENVQALELAAATARRSTALPPARFAVDSSIYLQARKLIEAVMELADDPGTALLAAFRRGYLDVPYCLHPNNAGRSRSYLDEAGSLQWADGGLMPLPVGTVSGHDQRMGQVTSSTLARDLTYVQRRFDNALSAADTPPALPPSKA